MQRDLVLRAKTGDHAAFTALAGGAIDRLHRTARLILPDGSVLLVGGATGETGTGDEVDKSRGEATRWDPLAGDTTSAGSPSEWRVDATATQLTDGRALIVGGRRGTHAAD
jgi:hypothetical protein